MTIVLDRGTHDGILGCDGRRTASVPPGGRVDVRRGAEPVRIARIAQRPFTDRLVAKVGPRGLLEMHFEGAATPLSIGVCLYPGDPLKPCVGGVATTVVVVASGLTAKLKGALAGLAL